MPMNTTFDSRRPDARAARAGPHHLLDDLTGREVAAEPRLTCRAEPARHRASRLAGHADGGAAGVVHQDGLDCLAAVDAEQPLDGRAAIRSGLRRGVERRAQLRSGGQLGP